MLKPHPYLAAALARSERRRAMLDELAQIGMTLFEAISKRGRHAPHDAELNRSLATVARSVRLTLALRDRLDRESPAMHADAMATHASRTSQPCVPLGATVH